MINALPLQDSLCEGSSLSLVGETLKTARLAQGLTLEQISKTLYIGRGQLSYIEDNENYTVCDVYILGFVKLYAQYLGLDAQDLVQKFKDQTVSPPKPTPLIFPAPLPGRGLPSRLVLLLSCLVLATIALGWRWVSSFSLDVASFF
jgi:cytoskeleton protein RodZ